MQYRSNLHLEQLAYGVGDTSNLTGLGRTSIYKWVKSGDLRATKCGRRTLFLAADIAAFLASLQQGDR